MYSAIEEHQLYLSDQRRIEAYDHAIHSVVQPGSSILDLGSGTGIMGFLACRAGAALVYSVDDSGMIEVARQAAADNAFVDRIRFINGFSTRIELPERVDVVVADQIGNFGVSARIVEYFADARARFLKPEGVAIPRRLDLWLCPLESTEFFWQVEFWNSRPAGLDLSGVRLLAANTSYQVDIPVSSLLAEPVLLVSIDLNHATTATIQGEASATVARAGILHGMGGWFEVELAPGIHMTNSPISSQRIKRRQIYFPIDSPIPVKEGDRVKVKMLIRHQDLVANWTVEVLRRGALAREGLFRHSTLKGMLLSREDFNRTRPDFVPRLNARGQAGRAVVGLCDGRRTVSQIEQAILRDYPDLFPSPEEISRFVAQVLGRDTE